MRVGQPVTLTTDAWPGETFPATVARISPQFEEASRQARIELTASNPEGDQGVKLKPGMFVRASVILAHVEDARVIPADALTRRANVTGVFRVNEEDKTAEWVPVTPGILHEGMVQIVEPELSGRVVTLGQQLLDTGSPLLISGDGEAE
jgi:multidrug efflux pump subunit AcrA (membrane-fusion protein)